MEITPETSCKAIINGCFVELSSEFWNPSPIKFHVRWLRDHCRCSNCYNSVTFQRKQTLLELPSELSIENCGVANGQLHIEWSDAHVTELSIIWLTKNNYEYCKYNKNVKNEKVLWNGEISPKTFAQVNRDDYMSQEHVAKEVVQSLYRYGVAMVHQVNPTEADTETIIRRLFPVQRTLFGDMWTFSDIMTHSDTAYTTSALGAHNDNTYFFNAAGLQILHCLEHSGGGGETLLIDGFYVAKRLQEDNPKCFDRLTKRNVSSEYIEEGYHYTATGPVIKLKGSADELEQIRFNIYDRGPVKVPENDVETYYNDMEELSSYIKNSKYELWFKLHPGTVLFFDNWRVFHGRASYSGHRVMSGSYVSRDDWLSKARTMNVIE